MSEQLFRATVRGVPDVLVLKGWDRREICDVYFSADFVEGWRVHEEKFVSNLRPVQIVEAGQIVLDQARLGDIENLTRHLDYDPVRDAGLPRLCPDVRRYLAQQISAQSRPARIEEPKGFGAIVEASSNSTEPMRQKWLRDGKRIWRAEDGTWTLNWSDLIDPEPVTG